MGLTGSVRSLDYLALYGEAAGRFVSAVAASTTGARVPGCPGWSVADLVVHVGNVHAWAATVVETGRRAPEQQDQPPSHRARAVSAWYLAKAEDLYAALRSTHPDTPCWNFTTGEGTADFWRRRQLHETTVHQVDLDAAHGRETPLVPEHCADGVDEVLTLLLPRMHRRRAVTLTAPLSVLTADTGEAWTLRPATTAAGPPEVARGRDTDADELEAPAALLYRLLWKRATWDTWGFFDDGQVVARGDEARVRAFLAQQLVP